MAFFTGFGNPNRAQNAANASAQNQLAGHNASQQGPQPHGNSPKQGYTQQEYAQRRADENFVQNKTSYVSTKIWKVNGKDKVMDFSAKLTRAKPEDFANVHGIGGSGHAYNSTVCVTICDFTKGKGENSITLNYGIDVEDMRMLLEAAMAARIGLLNQQPYVSALPEGVVPSLEDNLQQMARWTKQPVNPDGSICIPISELTTCGKQFKENVKALKQAARGHNNGNKVTFSYSRQKNHAFKNSIRYVNGVTYAPVKQINILFNPTRNYPWTIQIQNYDAPIVVKENGATNHNSGKAINKREAFMHLTADDFCAAMVAVDRLVRLWELRMFSVVDAGFRQYEGFVEATKNKSESHVG